MINTAFLHPWVKWGLRELLRKGLEADIAPVVTSTFRSFETQETEFAKCQTARRGQRGFPVKASFCSQHSYGFAFDMQAQLGLPLIENKVTTPGGLAATWICTWLPQATVCQAFGQPVTVRTPVPVAQDHLMDLGAQLDFRVSDSDPIHFGTFPAAVWDPHMRSTFGIDCSTCRYPGGIR